MTNRQTLALHLKAALMRRGPQGDEESGCTMLPSAGHSSNHLLLTLGFSSRRPRNFSLNSGSKFEMKTFSTFCCSCSTLVTFPDVFVDFLPRLLSLFNIFVNLFQRIFARFGKR